MYLYSILVNFAMKAAFVKDLAVVVNEIEKPKLGEGEILVKMQACGICVSE